MPAAKSDKTPKDKNKRDLKAEIEKTAKMFDDVVKPGETPAQATSRPVIVGHTAMIRDDPMMKDKTDDSRKDAGKDIPAKTHKARSVVPFGGEDTAEADNEPAKEIEAPDEDIRPDKITVSVVSKKSAEAKQPAADTSAPEPTEAADSATQETTESPSPAKSSATETAEASEARDDTTEAADSSEPEASVTEDQPDEATAEGVPAGQEAEQPDDNGPVQGVVDSLVEEADAKKENQKKDDQLALRAEEAEKLIASKEYFVPIGQVSRRRSNYRIFFGLIILLVLAAAAVNFAIDAEAVDVGVNAFTDFL